MIGLPYRQRSAMAGEGRGRPEIAGDGRPLPGMTGFGRVGWTRANGFYVRDLKHGALVLCDFLQQTFEKIS